MIAGAEDLVARVEPTITSAAATASTWDVVVIGAGPSGAAAALTAARAGASVLLIDRASFPRSKACGCCLGGGALAALDLLGLAALPEACGGRPLARERLVAGGREAVIPLPSGTALSRRSFDAALLRAALAAGAQLLPPARASIGQIELDARAIDLGPSSPAAAIRDRLRARIVIQATGLAGARGPGAVRTRAVPGSRFGLAATLTGPGASADAEITMAYGAGGYAGLVRLENGSTAIAAAVNPTFSRRSGGPESAAGRIFTDAGLPPPAGLDSARWIGTPPLTRHPPLEAPPRVLAVGDAAGFVEPFTGEGMGWALVTGRAAAGLALDAVHGRIAGDQASADWTRYRTRLLAARRRGCRFTAYLLRHPRVVRGLVRVLARRPALARPFVSHIQAPLA